MSRIKNKLFNDSPLSLVLVISSFESYNSGADGHYYSAMTTAEELSKIHVINIINLGNFPAPVLKKSKIPVTYININFGILGTNRNFLKHCLQNYQPDVVIAFDRISGLIMRTLCITLDCGFVLVKAGGEKPPGYYPNNLFKIHFSPKDANWDLARRKNNYAKISWIPNRVTIPNQDWSKIAHLKNKLSILPNDLVVLRISRITEAYRISFLAALKLVNFLRNVGYPARLIIIGLCQSESLLQEIKSQMSEQDAVITSEEFTTNASCLLKIAHINIGVGRGFMEGCALGQHMLAINAEEKLPIVVTQDNFEAFFQDNFSMRVRFPIDTKYNQEKIISVAELCMKGSIDNEASKQWFQEKFSSERICSLYGEILYFAQAYPERWTLDTIQGEFCLKNLSLRRFTKKVLKKIFIQNEM